MSIAVLEFIYKSKTYFALKKKKKKKNNIQFIQILSRRQRNCLGC